MALFLTPERPLSHRRSRRWLANEHLYLVCREVAEHLELANRNAGKGLRQVVGEVAGKCRRYVEFNVPEREALTRQAIETERDWQRSKFGGQHSIQLSYGCIRI